MALGFSIVKSWLGHPEQFRHGLVDVTLDASYVTGGWDMDADDILGLGLRQLTNFIPEPFDVSGTYFFVWDATNKKLKAFTAIGTEAAVDLPGLDGIVLRCQYLGG